MNEQDALNLIKQALDKVDAGISEKVSAKSNLVEDEILDSLDAMNFLFELNEVAGKDFPEIDDSYDDYRVSTLIEIIIKNA